MYPVYPDSPVGLFGFETSYVPYMSWPVHGWVGASGQGGLVPATAIFVLGRDQTWRPAFEALACWGEAAGGRFAGVPAHPATGVIATMASNATVLRW